jgi:hypothetical protein
MFTFIAFGLFRTERIICLVKIVLAKGFGCWCRRKAEAEAEVEVEVEVKVKVKTRFQALTSFLINPSSFLIINFSTAHP